MPHIATSLVLALFCFIGPSSMRASPRNILLILTDDLGWRDLSCYGSTFYETPNIDRLAPKGMRFTDAYAAAGVCSPTRAAVLTGKTPARLHLTDFIRGLDYPYAALTPPDWTRYLPHEEVTLAEMLKQVGYETLYFGKWHLGGEEHFPVTQGFDHSIAETESSVCRHATARRHQNARYQVEYRCLAAATGPTRTTVRRQRSAFRGRAIESRCPFSNPMSWILIMLLCWKHRVLGASN